MERDKRLRTMTWHDMIFQNWVQTTVLSSCYTRYIHQCIVLCYCTTHSSSHMQVVMLLFNDWITKLKLILSVQPSCFIHCTWCMKWFQFIITVTLPESFQCTCVHNPEIGKNSHVQFIKHLSKLIKLTWKPFYETMSEWVFLPAWPIPYLDTCRGTSDCLHVMMLLQPEVIDGAVAN